MSLDNLVKTKQLQPHIASKEAVQRLLQAAQRNLNDAHIAEVSAENRFDAAYKCMMQCAMLALWVNGYRTSTSQPGHHQTAIQTLPTSIGIPASTVIILDSLRKQRNLSDYEGDPISDQAVTECIKQATQLYQNVLTWMATHRAELM